MKRKKKVSLLILSTIVLTSALAACSSSNEAPKTVDKQAPVAKEGITIVDGKITSPVTITIARGEDPTVKFKNGETYLSNVHTKWAEEQLGVKIETLWSSPMGDNSYDTKLKLMLSSGDALPDMFVSTQPNTTNMFVESGKLLDVSEAFEKYASDTWKAALEEIPEAWYPVTQGDKKYGIPLIKPAIGNPLWIRQDWLTNLNLQAPTTLEELEKVMHAFVHDDPDQNGIDDTYAMDIAMLDAFTGHVMGDSSWIFGLFGAIPEIWYPDENGELQYGSIQPEIKDALIKIKEWKDKGYIAEDVALNDFNKIAENVASNKIGMLSGEDWLMAYPGSLLLASNPQAVYIPYTLPVGVNGKNMRYVSNPYTGMLLISKDISEEALQAFFHYQNKLYDTFNSSDPFMLKGYQEGYDYIIEDGKAITDESRIEGGRIQTMKYTITGVALSYQSKLWDAKIKRVQGQQLSDSELAGFATSGVIFDDYEDNPLERFPDLATMASLQQVEADTPNYFQGAATATMSSRSELLNKMQMDTFTEIIYGRQPVEAFDTFVEKWKSSGGNDMTKEVNEWYKSVSQ